MDADVDNIMDDGPPVEVRAAEPMAAAPRPPIPSRPRRWIPILLFVATCGSTLLVGIQTFAVPNAAGAVDWGPTIRNGATYAVAVMGILLAHEMGHFLQAVRYGIPASLPYFLPMPVGPFGTMGAVIVQGSDAADRRQLFDIAISGPIAGLVVTLPVLYLGVLDVQTAPRPEGTETLIFGDPLILQWLAEWTHGPLREGHDYIINPLLFAGWVGLFITSLNLMPIGQLDGGHMLYTMIGRPAHYVAFLLIAVAIGFMIWTAYPAFALMVLLLVLFGTRHPPTANDRVPLGWWRHVLGWLTLAFILIGFTATPITTSGS